MLIGSFEHNVDAKGRLFIPAKWREDMGDTVIVTRGMLGKDDGKCLFGMSVPAWQELVERFKKLAISDVTAQSAMRHLFANACECELDKQGRILINASLREYAGLSEGTVLAGMVTRIEIWNSEQWNKRAEADEEMGEDVLNHLSGLGI